MTTTTATTLTTRDGIDLHVLTVEPAEPRYELLHVHGLGEHSGRWVERFEQLAARGARVTALDLRGHGNSSGRRVYVDEFGDLATDVAEVAAATVAATGRPWVLYGHSMGALIGLGYLVDGHQPQPNISVLSAPPLADNAPKVQRIAAGILGRFAPKLTMKTTIKGEHLSSDPAVGEAYDADPLVQQIGSTGFGKCYFDEQKRLAPLVDRIPIPTLVIHGADDELVPPSASAPLARSITVERKVYPGFRHELHFEPDGARVIGDIGDWIDNKLG